MTYPGTLDDAIREIAAYRAALEDIVTDCAMLEPHISDVARGALAGIVAVAHGALRVYADRHAPDDDPTGTGGT